jgi:hypothetical protein
MVRSYRTANRRHGRACHRKSALPDLRHSIVRNSREPELRCHPRLQLIPRKTWMSATEARLRASSDAPCDIRGSCQLLDQSLSRVSLPLNPDYGRREYSVSSSENESLTRPSERHSDVFFTHRLTAGAYQTTKFQV